MMDRTKRYEKLRLALLVESCCQLHIPLAELLTSLGTRFEIETMLQYEKRAREEREARCRPKQVA